MSPEVQELFERLVDLSPEARAHYLADHPVDASTRREVEELLAHDSTNDSLSQLVASAAVALLREDAMGSRCGRLPAGECARSRRNGRGLSR